MSVLKKAKAILFGKEKAAHTEDTTARQSSDWRDHCARIFQRKEARFPAIQGFRYPCQGRNGAGGGYRLPGVCSHTREFPPAKKASQASSLDQAGTQ